VIDRKLFKALYNDHFEWVRTFFIHKGFLPEEAEELTQDTFLRVYRFKGDYKGIGSFQGWLHSICLNLWKNRIRDIHSRKRDATVVSLDPAVAEHQRAPEAALKSTNQLNQIINTEQRQLLRKAISQLTEAMYTCVVLRVYHELTYDEIATLLKVPRDTVKSRLYQAQGRLREILGDKMQLGFLE